MLNNPLNPDHVTWTHNVLSMLTNPGGRWIAPMWPTMVVIRTGDRSVMLDGELDDDNYAVLSAHILGAGWMIDNLK